MTPSLLLLLLALVFLVVSAFNRLPLWPAVLCLILERAVSLGWPR